MVYSLQQVSFRKEKLKIGVCNFHFSDKNVKFRHYRASRCFGCCQSVITVCIQTSYKLRLCIITSFTRSRGAPGLVRNINHIKECHEIQRLQYSATFTFRAIFAQQGEAEVRYGARISAALAITLLLQESRIKSSEQFRFGIRYQTLTLLDIWWDSFYRGSSDQKFYLEMVSRGTT